jgi:hypothetical protein
MGLTQITVSNANSDSREKHFIWHPLLSARVLEPCAIRRSISERVQEAPFCKEHIATIDTQRKICFSVESTSVLVSKPLAKLSGLPILTYLPAGPSRMSGL